MTRPYNVLIATGVSVGHGAVMVKVKDEKHGTQFTEDLLAVFEKHGLPVDLRLLTKDDQNRTSTVTRNKLDFTN